MTRTTKTLLGVCLCAALATGFLTYQHLSGHESAPKPVAPPSTTAVTHSHDALLVVAQAGGYAAGCSLPLTPFPHLHCYIILQPQTTMNDDFTEQYTFNNVSVYDAQQFEASAICGLITPIAGLAASLLCAAAVLYIGNEVRNDLALAAHQTRCEAFEMDDTPPFPPYNFRSYPDGGAHWQYPVYSFFNIEPNDPKAVWEQDDQCNVNLSDPGSWWWGGHWCGSSPAPPLFSWYYGNNCGSGGFTAAKPR